jgi:choline dehydrogenase
MLLLRKANIKIDTPANTYYDDMWNQPINWQFMTVPQPNVNGTGIEWPRGKTLGGSSAINGLYLTRPGEAEIEAWNGMLAGVEGQDNWTWDTMFAAMKKSQTFTAPSSAIASQAAITWNTASQGTDGPISASYPGMMLDMVGDWCTSNAAAGVPTSQDTYGGESWGCNVATSAINPANWTRSYSRTGYLDALPPRSNYAVLANAQVTRILFNNSSADNITATGVEYTTDGGSSTLNVTVAKEVILAGGAVGSPTVLMYSGVGPQDVLDAAGVDVVHALPGVGQHLQDHLSVYTQWSTNQQTAGSIYKAGGSEASSPEFLSLIADAVAYANATTVLGADTISSLTSSIQSGLSQYAPADSTVAAGYNTIAKNSIANLDSEIGRIELLMGINTAGAVSLGASLQYPLSQGSITIGSSNPMDDPTIDPMYLTNPADAQILVAGLQLVRKIGESAPFSNYLTEDWPGSDVQSEEEWTEWMKGNVFTNYHPASTCAMLPLDQGGVVDGNLRVYGLSNVRVADASVPPFVFSAHLMSSTYGLAEQASTIISNYWQKKEQAESALAVHSSSHNKISGLAHKSGSGSKDSSDKKGNAAASNARSPSLSIAAFVSVVTYAIFAF